MQRRRMGVAGHEGIGVGARQFGIAEIARRAVFRLHRRLAQQGGIAVEQAGQFGYIAGLERVDRVAKFRVGDLRAVRAQGKDAIPVASARVAEPYPGVQSPGGTSLERPK